MALILEREELDGLAALLEYPRTDPGARLLQVRDALAHCCPGAAAALDRAREESQSWSLGRWEEAHLRTFDLAANCAPYVGVHLYGEETFKRGALLARLRGAFEERGFSSGAELPDHAAVLLRFAGRLEPEDRAGLAQWLCGLAEEMRRSLEQTDNPYRHVAAALAEVVEGMAADLPRIEKPTPPANDFLHGAESCAGCSLTGVSPAAGAGGEGHTSSEET